MFKYLSEILKQFSPTQRILALLILVLTITILTLGNTYLNNVSVDTEYYKEQIKILNKKIVDNETRHSDELIESHRTCTEEMIQRELDIVDEIERLKTSLGNVSKRSLAIVSPSDSVVSSPIRILPDNSMDMMMNGLDNLKGKILTNVNEMSDDQ
jgi:hypothetical protein